MESSEEDSEEDEVVIKRKKSPASSKASEKVPDAASGSTKKVAPKTVASMLAARADPFESSDDSVVMVTDDVPTDLRKPKSAAPAPSTTSEAKSTARVSADNYEVESDNGDGRIPVLPDEIPKSLRNVIDEIKQLAFTWDGGKCNFFNPEHNPIINGLLLR